MVDYALPKNSMSLSSRQSARMQAVYRRSEFLQALIPSTLSKKDQQELVQSFISISGAVKGGGKISFSKGDKKQQAYSESAREEEFRQEDEKKFERMMKLLEELKACGCNGGKKDEEDKGKGSGFLGAAAGAVLGGLGKRLLMGAGIAAVATLGVLASPGVIAGLAIVGAVTAYTMAPQTFNRMFSQTAKAIGSAVNDAVDVDSMVKKLREAGEEVRDSILSGSGPGQGVGKGGLAIAIEEKREKARAIQQEIAKLQSQVKAGNPDAAKRVAELSKNLTVINSDIQTLQTRSSKGSGESRGYGADGGAGIPRADGTTLDNATRIVSQFESGGHHTTPNGQVIIGDGGQAVGLMQLHPDAARDAGGTPEDRYDEGKNFEMGKNYLQKMYNKFGNWPDAFLAYNWGPGAVANWKKGGPAPEQWRLDRADKSVAMLRKAEGLSPGQDIQTTSTGVAAPGATQTGSGATISTPTTGQTGIGGPTSGPSATQTGSGVPTSVPSTGQTGSMAASKPDSSAPPTGPGAIPGPGKTGQGTGQIADTSKPPTGEGAKPDPSKTGKGTGQTADTATPATGPGAIPDPSKPPTGEGAKPDPSKTGKGTGEKADSSEPPTGEGAKPDPSKTGKGTGQATQPLEGQTGTGDGNAPLEPERAGAFPSVSEDIEKGFTGDRLDALETEKKKKAKEALVEMGKRSIPQPVYDAPKGDNEVETIQQYTDQNADAAAQGIGYKNWADMVHDLQESGKIDRISESGAGGVTWDESGRYLKFNDWPEDQWVDLYNKRLIRFKKKKPTVGPQSSVAPGLRGGAGGDSIQESQMAMMPSLITPSGMGVGGPGPQAPIVVSSKKQDSSVIDGAISLESPRNTDNTYVLAEAMNRRLALV